MSILNKSEETKGIYFPLRSGGMIEGINDAGIETFNDVPMYSLTKEVLQNSLDARKNHNEPVKVEFKKSTIDKSKVPYGEELKKIIENCRDYWKENNQKTTTFMNNAIDVLSKENIEILSISDFNTKGLKGAEKDNNSAFSDLVKSVGVSNKSGEDGGSFGIGKNAPFACSALRTVLYSTLDDEGVLAIQGVSKLVTHKNNENRDTRGTGFIGVTLNNESSDIINRPFINEDVNRSFDDMYIRREVGTTVHILGFNKLEDWKELIVQATLDYYFVAIYEGNLEVVVEEIVLNKNTIRREIELRSHKNNILTRYYFYSLYKSNENIKKFTEKDFRGLGEIELNIILDSEAPKKIAVVRGSGMKVIDKDRFRVIVPFAGVLRIKGEGMNKFIRSLENPSHDKIEPNRSEEPQKAKKIIDELYRWIKDKINELQNQDDVESINVKGIGQFLPSNRRSSDIDVDLVEGKNKIEKITPKKNIKVKKASKSIESKMSDWETEGYLEGYTNGDINTDGDKGGYLNGRGIRNNQGTKGNINNTNDKPNERNTTEKIIPIKIKKIRIFCIDSEKQLYKVIINSQNKANAKFQLKIIGEDGYILANILSAKNNGVEIPVNNNIIGPVKFSKGETKVLEVNIDSKEKVAMEVLANANNI